PFGNLPKAKAENSATPKKEIVMAKIEKAPVNGSGTGILPAKNRLEACSTKPNWTTKLNPFLNHAPEPKNERPVLQTELSLDSVKVVHNDLTDADVEIVPMKSRQAPPDLQPARKSWEILGERLLKATAL
ncbi:MAG TPA: hypothetical protein VN516_05875, partial [Candidatus Baltobacteraceae bacterium]|nr:hypothetical protein [Candidatus Baltobacteraceae bacterium]